MTLWSRTYLRGESFLVSDDIEDLNLHGFDNKLVSLEVSAGCCWTIFSEPHFQGDSKVFQELAKAGSWWMSVPVLGPDRRVHW